jgi:exosome complex RNA-binding protein Rrp4
MNGIIWIKAASIKEAIVIRNVLLNSETLNQYQIEAMIELLIQRMKQF